MLYVYTHFNLRQIETSLCLNQVDGAHHLNNSTNLAEETLRFGCF